MQEARETAPTPKHAAARGRLEPSTTAAIRHRLRLGRRFMQAVPQGKRRRGCGRRPRTTVPAPGRRARG